jgi:hypothetical protein
MTAQHFRTKGALYGVLLVACLCLFISAPKVSALYTTAQINAKLQDGTASAVGYDNGYCRQHLFDNITINDTNTLRASLNGDGNNYKSASYYDDTWLSARGIPNTNNPVSVAWGATSVPLQVNSLTFLCGPMVSPETYGPSPVLAKNPYSLNLYKQTARWVTSAANANDRTPLPIGTSNMRPARVDTFTQIYGYTVQGRPGASISPSTGTQYIKRDSNSRYWFAPALPVTYNDPAGITSTITIKITVNFKRITGYHSLGSSFPPRAEACKDIPGDYRNINISNCTMLTDTLTITLRPNPTLAATTAVDKATVPLGSTAKFTHTITKTGSANVNYVWRVCSGIYAAATTTPGQACTGYTAATNNFSVVRPYVNNNPADVGKYYCERIRFGVSAAAGDSGGSSGKCTRITGITSNCGDFQLNPSTIDPFDTFSITVGGTNAGGVTSPGDTMTLSIAPIAGNGTTWTPPAAQVGVRPATGYPASATYNAVGPTGETGEWDVTWVYHHVGSSDQTCQDKLRVVNKPYLHVYGGDTAVGDGTIQTANNAQACVANDDAGVYSWNNRDANYTGAGAQYAVMALGQILDYSSAAGSTNPVALSFANTGLDPTTELNVGQGLFGGMYDGRVGDCDFTSDITVTPDTTPQTIDQAAVGPLGSGSQVIRYVVGADVYITGTGIRYGSTSWGSVADIPYFKLVVVGGNIYIGNNVTQLDGIYVAEAANDGAGNMKGGTIYTCALGMGTPADITNIGAPPNNFYNQCIKRLTINGAFAAQQIQFLRTFGTVGNSKTDTQASNNAAEVFNYSPEVWLPRTPTNIIGTKYDAITGLPPVL